MSAIDEIKARIDIVDLVSETVKLRRSGKNYVGFCPFHDNRKTPAFAVFPDSGSWRCFGQCNEGGDIFGFVMKKEGWDFSEALRYLAERAGVVLEPVTPEIKFRDEKLEKIHNLLEEAVIFYKHQLVNTDQGKFAHDYIVQRGIKPETIDLFGLGYAPGSWDVVTNYFSNKGYSKEELIEAGLVSQRENEEGIYDRFRNRLMFPIRNVTGKMVGFGARALSPDDNPKYLNSPQSTLFDKGHLLYGLDLARKAIRDKDQVIIVEGYMDVIVPYQEGYLNIVSPMGTAISADQLIYLKKLTRNIVMALDPDAAGEKATLRGLELARESLDRSFDPAPDGKGISNTRGLVKHESRLNVDLRVASLPDDKDPDEIVLEDPELFGKIIENAQPIVVHVMETLVASQDITIPKVKDQIATYMLLLIEDVQSKIERDAYIQRLARLLKLDERTLLGLKSTQASKRKGGRKKQSGSVSDRPDLVSNGTEKLALALENHILRLLIRDPESIFAMDRILVGAGLERFTEQDFEQSNNQMMARVIIDSINQDEEEIAIFIENNMPDVFLETYNKYLEPMIEGEPNTNHLREDLIRSLMRLRQVRITDGIDQLRNIQEEMQEEGTQFSTQIQERILQYIKQIYVLNQSLTKPISLD